MCPPEGRLHFLAFCNVLGYCRTSVYLTRLVPDGNGTDLIHALSNVQLRHRRPACQGGAKVRH
ncbi:hypothetical protein MBAV_004010 [Candidatus Magnetobacterium bavaricum]|uniref:Uncharacterized protein n=1 Tax=Candidatus Magnetobacterium bavaricum TaxID=29290 RepID=A0A0F3GT05_9BACT|nr:hypothetical protein MBAV_004010 [Candidatus Magnetobacterium bavaricum]